MHMIDIGVQSHCGACIRGAARLDAAANFGAIHGKEDHRLHAKRLDDVQGHREVGSIVAAIVSRFGDVLRPQSKGDLFSNKCRANRNAAATLSSASHTVRRRFHRLAGDESYPVPA